MAARSLLERSAGRKARAFLGLTVALCVSAGVVGGCTGSDGEESALSELVPAATSTTSAVTSTSIPPPSRAEVILADMTLTEKASQVLWVGFVGKSLSSGTAEVLVDYGRIGGLILLQQNIGGPKTLRTLTSDIQDKAESLGLPLQLFIGVDQEGGRVSRITTDMPRVPGARVLGVESTPEHAGELAGETARALLDLGVNLNLAPVGDVAAKGAYMGDRSFGSDPQSVSDFVS